jgi:antitoxin VapB
MALHIASERVDRLARELAAATGERLTTTVERALEERLARVKPPARSPEWEEEWRRLEQSIARTRVEALASANAGAKPMTKEELEAMLGFDEY